MENSDQFDRILDQIAREDIISLVKDLAEICEKNHAYVAVAESMTAGLLSAAITSVPGASSYFLGGSVCYQPKAKYLGCGVSPKKIFKYGAVSEEVTRDMASGIRIRMQAVIGLAITGIAGPNPGVAPNAGLPGTVYISISKENKDIVKKFMFEGNRDTVRYEAVKAGLRLLIITLREIGG